MAAEVLGLALCVQVTFLCPFSPDSSPSAGLWANQADVPSEDKSRLQRLGVCFHRVRLGRAGLTVHAAWRGCDWCCQNPPWRDRAPAWPQPCCRLLCFPASLAAWWLRGCEQLALATLLTSEKAGRRKKSRLGEPRLGFVSRSRSLLFFLPRPRREEG